MTTYADLAALRQAVGTHLGYSSWHTITQQQIDLFAEATHDHQWIHVDPDRAAAGPFGATIAHGYLSLALIPTLLDEIYTVESLAMGVNYGCNKLRFPAPVRVGARLRAGAELLSLQEHSAGTQLIALVTMEIEGSPKPSCVAEIIYILTAL
jgi:acyl dehydratase